MKALMKAARAIPRLLGVALVTALTLPAQMLVAGPIFRNYDALPKIGGRIAGKILGIHVDVKGAPEKTGHPMINIANHLSGIDNFILMHATTGATVGKSDVASWPVIGLGAKAIGSILVRRNAGGKFLPEVHEKLAKTLNSGRNVIVFPEGTTTDGAGVLPFKAGVLSVLFNNLSQTKLEKDVGVQPFAIRIAKVDGKDPAQNPALRGSFAWCGSNQGLLSHLWEIAAAKSIRLELDVLPAMNPKDYKDFKEMAAAAHGIVQKAVLAPVPSA